MAFVRDSRGARIAANNPKTIRLLSYPVGNAREGVKLMRIFGGMAHDAVAVFSRDAINDFHWCDLLGFLSESQ